MTSPRVPVSTWVRWSFRDLRQRWILVAAIALVLGLGTGMFAALGSTAVWRRQSNDASFAAVAFHDLRVVVPEGATVDEGSLRAILDDLPHAEWVTGADERLRVPSQVEATGVDERVLVRGEIVGVDVSDGRPEVDRVHVAEGDPLTSGATGVLEMKFADEYSLPTRGEVVLAGGVEVAYGGVGVGPEEFIVIGDEAGLLGHRNWATLYLPLERAQEVTGLAGQVDDLVLRATDTADLDLLAHEIEVAAAEYLGGVGVTIEDRDDALAYRTLYDDIENDQKMWNVMAGLILVGAVFAAFNLVSRVVESQRREIGVGMALGVAPRQLAIRPLLLGLEVGVLGAAFGVAVGLLIGSGMQSLFRSFAPLPVWVFDFQYGEYAQGIALGLVLPVLAAAIPVWRAVRVEPVDAIRTVHVQQSGGVLGRVGRRLRVPGRSLAQMPLRNLLRTPRRAVLTSLAVGAAITTLVTVLGVLDSLTLTVDRAGEETLQDQPDRLDAQLTTFYEAGGPEIGQIASLDGVEQASAGVQLPGIARAADGSDDASVDLLIRSLDFGDGVWTPTFTRTTDALEPRDGLVLSEKAAEDLGVEPGDDVVLQHPRLGESGLAMASSTVRLSALHPDPIRAFAYLDLSQAGRFGLGDTRNYVQLLPSTGFEPVELQRALFDLPQVATTQSAAALVDTIDEAIAEVAGLLRILQAGILVLALLIAFNASSISADERAREHATMFAFGVPIRSVTVVNVAESAVIGMAGTLVGLAGGYVVVRWMIEVLLNDTLPELGLLVHLSGTTMATVVILGVAVVALAPVMSVRRLLRMPIPDTLRIVE